MADELETCAFAKLGEMKVVRYMPGSACAVDRTYDAGIWFAVHVPRHACWVLAVA